MKYLIFFILLATLGLSSACSQSSKAEGSAPEVVNVPQKRSAEVKAAKPAVGIAHIKEVVRRYNSTSGVRMKLKKKVHLELLDQEKTSEGELKFSKGRLRLEIEKPETNYLIMDGSNIWVENRLPKELGGKIQVAKMRSPKGAGRKKAPLAFLLHTEEVWDEFKITKSKSERGFNYYELMPKKPDRLPEIMNLKLKIHRESSAIRSLSFEDELENLTVFSFNSIEFDQSFKKSVFRYTPPSQAEVTEY